jgi:hypothetical protein
MKRDKPGKTTVILLDGTKTLSKKVVCPGESTTVTKTMVVSAVRK